MIFTDFFDPPSGQTMYLPAYENYTFNFGGEDSYKIAGIDAENGKIIYRYDKDTIQRKKDNMKWQGSFEKTLSAILSRAGSTYSRPMDTFTVNTSQGTVQGIYLGTNQDGNQMYLGADNPLDFSTGFVVTPAATPPAGQQGSSGQQSTPQQGTPNTGATFEDTGADRNNALISQMTQGNENILAGGGYDSPTTSAGVLEGLLTAGQRMAGGSRGRLFNI